ncbi:MAG: hypothetical protein IJY10_03650 [Lachnospiraceae bacterium]|nr:hypothetical protein [Lachnospiraceae bacterium]
MEYIMQEKKLVWDFDKTQSDASKIKENNLFIEGLWNMKDTVGHNDACVAVSILSEDSFSFITFNGLAYTMKINGDMVECIGKTITK